MSNDRNKFRIPVMGVSSLLIIFAVLCMTVFAILSVSTVSAGQRLSDKSAEAVTNYYSADTQAEHILAGLRQGKVPEGVVADGNIYAFSCPASETLELQVRVQVSGQDYEILQWQMVSTAGWQADESLNLWEGQ